MAMRQNERGFTLIEILIALFLISIVTAAIYKTFRAQQRSYMIQEEVVEMQQNLRAGMEILTREIRMAGYDPENSGFFAVTDITPRDISNNLDLTANGNSHIQFTSDLDADGIIDADETVSYSIFDFPVAAPDGQFDLARLLTLMMTVFLILIMQAELNRLYGQLIPTEITTLTETLIQTATATLTKPTGQLQVVLYPARRLSILAGTLFRM